MQCLSLGSTSTWPTGVGAAFDCKFSVVKLESRPSALDSPSSAARLRLRVVGGDIQVRGSVSREDYTHCQRPCAHVSTIQHHTILKFSNNVHTESTMFPSSRATLLLSALMQYRVLRNGETFQACRGWRRGILSDQCQGKSSKSHKVQLAVANWSLQNERHW